MTGTINQKFRQRLLEEFLDGGNITSVYLVFSNDTTRSKASTDNLSESPISEIHVANSAVTARYAVRLDTGDRMQYARVKKSGDTGGTEILLNSVNYIVSTDISSSNELWTNVYFNAPIPTDLDENFNIISVVINLDSTDSVINANDFTNAMFANAEIIMMTKPRTRNFDTDITDAQFPGAIRF